MFFTHHTIFFKEIFPAQVGLINDGGAYANARMPNYPPPDTTLPAPEYSGKNSRRDQKKPLEAGNPSALISPSNKA